MAGNFPTIRTTGDRGLDELLRRMDSRLAVLERAPAAPTVPGAAAIPAPAFGGTIEVRNVAGSFSAQEQGIEFDESNGFSLAQSGSDAAVSLPTVSTGDLTTTGDFAHTGSTKKVGFFGISPGTLTSPFTMTYNTGGRTNSNLTAANVSTTAATNTTPYGYTTAAQADAIPVAVNALIADVLNIKQVLTEVIHDLIHYGLLH